jgi:Beta-propeller repeat/3'-5' exonuclease
LVEARYVLKQGKEVSIVVGSYDVAKPLIIDPVLSYSTYLGGSDLDFGVGIAVDTSGNAYVTGNTSSPDFPIVHPLPAPNNALQGNNDAFVSKLSFDSATSTLSLAYSTYLGGSSGDAAGVGITVDTSGNAYVTGNTSSPDFPTVHPLPAPDNALRDAFVAKLAPTCTTPLTITDVSVNPTVLWPPNHKMVNAMVNYKVTAGCGGTTTSSLSVASKLGDLISDRLDIDLTKDEGGSNWSAQKLTFSQLQYAADDVGFLYDLKDRLTKEIKHAEMNDIFDLEMLVLPISAQLHLTGIAVDRTEVQEIIGVASLWLFRFTADWVRVAADSYCRSVLKS